MAYSSHQGACWIKSSYGRVPQHSVQAGYDTISQCDIYICRAYYEGQLVPGKVAPSHHCAYIGVNNKEVKVEEYEVLTDPTGQLTWKAAGDDGGIPFGAQIGGHDTTRMTLFVARGKNPSGDHCCGKYVPQTKKCYLPWNMKEHVPRSFEFLVQK